MRLLIKETEPTGGTIHVAGRDLSKIARRRVPYYRRNVGMVFQSLALFPHLTVAENIAYGPRIRGESRAAQRERAERLLELVRLQGLGERHIAALSGGQRQRVAIARALVNDPAIVWADEPTGALDSTTANEIMGLIRELNERRGLTVVIVTHDPGVGQRCDRIVRMRDGLIVGESVPTEREAPVGSVFSGEARSL